MKVEVKTILFSTATTAYHRKQRNHLKIIHISFECWLKIYFTFTLLEKDKKIE